MGAPEASMVMPLTDYRPEMPRLVFIPRRFDVVKESP
jgi:hypothetical protein